jgi:hypothetical protein
VLIRSSLRVCLVCLICLVLPALGLFTLGCSALTKPNEIAILGEGQKAAGPGVAAPTAPPTGAPAPRTLRPSPAAGH